MIQEIILILVLINIGILIGCVVIASSKVTKLKKEVYDQIDNIKAEIRKECSMVKGLR